MTKTEIPKRDSRKPDPSEPWRYVCPECGCQVRGNHSTVDRYRCRGCETAWDGDELEDKKAVR